MKAQPAARSTELAWLAQRAELIPAEIWLRIDFQGSPRYTLSTVSTQTGISLIFAVLPLESVRARFLRKTSSGRRFGVWWRR